MLSNNELAPHFLEAREVIETYVSSTIWRTAVRIQELIRMNYPLWKNNTAISDEVYFSHALLSLFDDETLTAFPYSDIRTERFEEGHHEPILLSDTQILGKARKVPENARQKIPAFQRINVRGIIVQRELYRLLCEGYEFQEAGEMVTKLHPEIREEYVYEFWKNGLSKNNIFYKRQTEHGRKKTQANAPAFLEWM